MTVVVLLLPRTVLAVDGISVTTHWSGYNAYGFGGFGEIWRHDIVDSQVLDHVLLYSGNSARSPVISPDGSRVAGRPDDSEPSFRVA